MKKLAEDLEKGAIGAEKAIELIMQGMEEFDGMMDRTANETVSGLKSQLEDVFEINIARKWGQGLQDGAKRGLGSIVKLLDESEDGIKRVGDVVYEVGKELSNWAADKLEGTIDKILEITSSKEFKDASLFGKAKMLFDGTIVEPLEKWWNSPAVQSWIDEKKEWLREKAASWGESLGSGLSDGILTLLGADVTDSISDGISIGSAFAKGFAEGFDASAVTKALVKAIKDVWGELPGWAKFLIGTHVGGKAISGIGNVIGGIGNIAGAVGKVTPYLSKAWGSFSIAPELAGTGLAGGTGIANFLGQTGMALGSGATTAGGLMAAGGGAVAGGIAAGATLIKGGIDLYGSYKAYKAGDKTEAKAKGASGGTAIGGVAAGAGIGAAIGSVVPVLGTAVGALIGAGVGGIAGWIGGDKWAKNIRENAAEIESAKYASKEMKEAVKNTELSSEELQDIFADACWKDMEKRFGEVELSMAEINEYAKGIVFGTQTKDMEKLAKASQTASQSLSTFKDAAADMERLNFDMSERNWKIEAGLDVKLTDEEIKEVKARVQNFMDSAEKVLSDSHYEFNMAVDLLIKPNPPEDGTTYKSVIESGNKLYQKLQKDLDSANKELEAQYDIALKDGIITADEQKVISDYQNKVAEIIEKVSNAETEASFEVAKINFTTGDLSAESFANLQSSLNSQMNDYVVQQEEALKVAISGLKLSKSEGAITQEDYDAQVKALIEGYNANIEQMSAKVEKVQLEGIAEAFDGVGTVEQLQGAISALTEEGKNPVDLTFKDINAHLDISADSLKEEEKANFTAVMQQALQSSMTGEKALKPTADVETKLTANEEKLKESADGVKSTAQTTLQNSFTDPLKVNGKANLSLTWDITSGKTATVDINGSSKKLTASVTTGKKANGGYVDKAIQTIVGEAGPEMIIPLSANRRQRGKALWERAGRAMGLWGSEPIMNANGGLYGLGSSRLGDMMNSAHSGESTETPQSTGGSGVHVEVGGVHITIQSGDNGAAEDIKQNADNIAGIIADALEQAFQNMPLTATT